jgi:hypothetical protein
MQEGRGSRPNDHSGKLQLTGCMVGAHVGQILKLVSKYGAWRLCCSAPCNIHKVIWVRDGNWPDPLHLRTCQCDQGGSHMNT